MGERKSQVVIAVIDSGIDDSKSDLADFVVKSTGFRVNEDGYIIEDPDMKIKQYHGTIIAMIIRQICPQIKFLSINILNERLSTDGRVLLHAFDQVLAMKPDIIHMSLGTTRFRYRFPLQCMVKKAIKQNTLVVSAANNEGHTSYPAFLKGVIGVKSEEDVHYLDYNYRNNFFYAYPGVENIYGIEEVNAINAKGNSMAAAYITGHIARYVVENNLCKPCEIIKLLKK